jgi:hypothetical protein
MVPDRVPSGRFACPCLEGLAAFMVRHALARIRESEKPD